MIIYVSPEDIFICNNGTLKYIDMRMLSEGINAYDPNKSKSRFYMTI